MKTFTYAKMTCSILFAALITFAVVQNARATLGEPADSPTSDRKANSTVQRAILNRSGCTVRESKSETNTMREYISPLGVVFAIAWNGISSPDLTSQLGTYADEYQKALRQTSIRKGRRHLQVKGNRVIVEKWGHLRNMQGRAYIPTLIPSGVSIEEIK